MCGKSNNIDIIAAQKVERQKVSCNKANMYSWKHITMILSKHKTLNFNAQRKSYHIDRSPVMDTNSIGCFKENKDLQIW